LFSRAICFKAPYFASISPRIDVLEAGRCEASLRHRRRVTNHLGTVHAIALCNLAELAGGLMTDASIPASMRWIPKGMTVEYLKKATGTMRATATPTVAIVDAQAGYELPVDVVVVNAESEAVFRAKIAMWVSPKR
jgi:acyl-coenzyme A thioesterase PaaI-like protein